MRMRLGGGMRLELGGRGHGIGGMVCVVMVCM